MKPIVFRVSAKRELTTAGDWLDEQRAGAGGELASLVRDAADLISGMPEAFAIQIAPNVRRFLIGRFDFLIFYVDEPSRVVILAIVHGRRSPAWITHRVRSALGKMDEQ